MERIPCRQLYRNKIYAGQIAVNPRGKAVILRTRKDFC